MGVPVAVLEEVVLVPFVGDVVSTRIIDDVASVEERLVGIGQEEEVIDSEEKTSLDAAEYGLQEDP